MSPLLMLMFACEPRTTVVENYIESCCCDDTGDTVVDDGAPSGYAVAEAVDIGTLCGDGEATVQVGNDGDAELLITDVSVSGGDWSVASFPGSVTPGGIEDIVLVGSDGTGTVTIATNDPVSPVITATVTAAANQPPVLTLDTPPDIIAPGAAETFTATVDDSEDGPDGLALSWSSDVDGVLSTDSADAAGAADMLWDGSLQSAGTHTVTLTATDSCGVSVSESVVVCQNEGYTEESFDLSTWQFTGNAFWDTTNEWVELTDTSRYIAGTAFYTDQTVDSDNVSISFLFYAGNKDSTGADGLTLTAIDTTRMTTYQGASGGSIGYGGLPGWTVEVDTWHNSESSYDEPFEGDHISFVIDGDSTSAGEVSAAIHEVEDGKWHEMTVEVSGQHVTVSIDGTTYIDEKVPAITSFPAHVGFTSATGNNTNDHLIDALAVERFVCED